MLTYVTEFIILHNTYVTITIIICKNVEFLRYLIINKCYIQTSDNSAQKIEKLRNK